LDEQCKSLHERFTLLEIILNVLRRMTFTECFPSIKKEEGKRKPLLVISHFVSHVELTFDF
jgi:hypothetical protein